jgi:hypothetical protein
MFHFITRFYGIPYISLDSQTIDGGIDIVDKENVGVTNRVSFHGLKLQNGHKYYVVNLNI